MFVKLDFGRTYSIDPEEGSLNKGIFYTVLRSGQKKRMMMEISTTPHPHMKNIYNLAFGPLNRKGRIKDKELIIHADYSKAFSTILFFAKRYLEEAPDHAIGLDGSTNSRAYLYFRIIRQNYDYLSEQFEMYGVKYYVRLKRKGPELYENPFDFRDVEYGYHRLLKDELEYNRELETMFNYFIFTKKQ
jgi:hypothetical protein